MATISETLRHARSELSAFDEAALEVEVLLCHAVKKSRTWIHTWPNKEIGHKEYDYFNQLIEQRKQGTPLAYITGTRDFWRFSLKVSPAVLIPRPETECLVEAALDLIPDNAKWRLADLGTGSGAIALALANDRPQCEMVASDISYDALKIAQANCDSLNLDNISFIHSSWFEQIEGKFNLIASNPPYIAKDDPHLKQGDLPCEPDIALSSNSNGLADIEIIIKQATAHLQEGGWLVLEHGWNQRENVARLFTQFNYMNIRCIKDLAGQDRISLAQYHANAN